MNTKKLFMVSKKNESYEDNNIKYSERNKSEPISNPINPPLEENEVPQEENEVYKDNNIKYSERNLSEPISNPIIPPQEESGSFVSMENEDNDINWSNSIDNLNIFFKE